MSENQNNTVKPSVHKLSLKTPLQRPQTEGYEKDENLEVNLKPLTANAATSKPTLNLGASSYIPKSMSINTNTENKPVATWEPTQNVTPQLLNTNTPSFTPKMPFNPNMPNQQQNVPINNSYPNMGQSKILLKNSNFL
jgi:hypothetical protein